MSKVKIPVCREKCIMRTGSRTRFIHIIKRPLKMCGMCCCTPCCSFRDNCCSNRRCRSYFRITNFQKYTLCIEVFYSGLLYP
ncbi:unnamed protein product [Moneuplotes crassus]|uniref:Uncharacterized protein n=1 Tax=Euplotes crassus TaxID=5936 RepID=A0AAD1U7A2_EUPCR|nr:unnamed protein product [Moneuplotes crassus]